MSIQEIYGNRKPKGLSGCPVVQPERWLINWSPVNQLAGLRIRAKHIHHYSAPE